MPNAAARTLWPLRGGLHLPDNKAQSLTRPLEPARLPKRLVIPLQQHIGAEPHPLVHVGQRVLKGQMLAEAHELVSAAVHASTSGMVVDISWQPVPHPSGLNALSVIIEPDGEEEWIELPPPATDFRSIDPREMRRRVRNAGVVGMGGAAFPSVVKLDPSPTLPIHTLVLNGAECEPFITCDDLVMRHRADRIVTGAQIMAHLLGVKRCIIGIEDNKPEAAEAMRRAVTASGWSQAEVSVIPTRYPSGGEKQLIYILTGQEIPTGGIPAQIGMVCHNVGTAAAVADAVLECRPLISRYVTLTGEGLAEQRNLDVLVGTLVGDLIAQIGGYTPDASRLIIGGPMMGFAVRDDNVPITKAANCVLVPSAREAPHPGAAQACIRCGRCAEACPMALLPQQMYWHARAHELDRAKGYNLFDCIECGCCSHVCPSHIPLVQYFRFAKAEIRDEDRQHRKAAHAKARSDSREARIRRQEEEKAAKLAAKKAALAQKDAQMGGDAGEDPKAAAIEAAKARAAAKKAERAAQGVAPQNTDHLTPEQQRQVEQADARRAAASTTEEA